MSFNTIRKIAFITSTRADWGLLMPIAKALDERDDVAVQIIATNMHLMERYGMTVNEITASGLTVNERVDMAVDGDDPASRVRAMSRCMSGMADSLQRLTPDMVVILGDRYEMLAAASAAAMMTIPIIHIAGGEISEGAIDDAIRHAITKLSSLHLTATEPYRQRVIQMGEQPDRVINTGAIGVWNIFNQPVMSSEELSQSLDGFEFNRRRTLLVTYHPATLDTNMTPAECFANLLTALDNVASETNVLITYPNNDSGGEQIIEMIKDYAARNVGRVHAVKSLGMKRYLSALRYVAAVVGNSSSGIVEVPTVHIPTVNIGVRQRGRLAGDSVINSGDSADNITRAIRLALSDEGQDRAARADNPYYKPDTLSIMVNAIMSVDPAELKHKHFHDIPTNQL